MGLYHENKNWNEILAIMCLARQGGPQNTISLLRALQTEPPMFSIYILKMYKELTLKLISFYI